MCKSVSRFMYTFSSIGANDECNKDVSSKLTVTVLVASKSNRF